MWVHVGKEPYVESVSSEKYFCDFYRNNQKLKRVMFGGVWHDGSGRFDWSPSGNFAIVGDEDWNSYFVTAESLDGIRFDKFYVSDDQAKTMTRNAYLFVPPESTSPYRGAVWHPGKDVFANITVASRNIYRDGLLVAGEAFNWHVALYDAKTRALLHAFPVDEPRDLSRVALSNRLLAAGGEGRCIFIFDLLTGATRQLFGHARRIESLHFSPDGQRLLSSGGGTCIVWNPVNGDRVASWDGAVDRRLRESPWSPDSQMVATSGLEVRRMAI